MCSTVTICTKCQRRPTRSDKTIFLEADRTLVYDRVVQVMDECRTAGVTTIGVLTKKPETVQ
jgi:biopolymer transport protein ExbD